MCDAFPGSLKTGILLNNLRFAEEMDSVTEEIANQHHEVFIVANLLIQYAKTGDINNLDGYKGPYLNTRPPSCSSGSVRFLRVRRLPPRLYLQKNRRHQQS